MPTTLRLLNVTVTRSQSLILDVNVDAAINDFVAYGAPTVSRKQTAVRLASGVVAAPHDSHGINIT